MEAAYQADQFAALHELKQLPIERNAQRVGELEIAGALRMLLEQLFAPQFIERRFDLFVGEIASDRSLERQQGKQVAKIGAGAIGPQQGAGQRDFMGIGGEPLLVELAKGIFGRHCIEKIVDHGNSVLSQLQGIVALAARACRVGILAALVVELVEPYEIGEIKHADLFKSEF